MRRRFLLALGGAAVVLAAGAVGAWLFVLEPSEPTGSIDTDLEGVTVIRPAKPAKPRPQRVKRPRVPDERPCWKEFGGDPQRSLSRATIQLGRPTKPIWARAVGGYIEYPPSYCDGRLYVNTFRGRTAAFDASTGKAPLVADGSRCEALHSCDRRLSADRVVEERQRQGARSRDGRAALAATDLGEDRVVAGGDREHRLLRRDRRTALRRQCRHRRGALGVRHRRTNQRQPVDLGQPDLHRDVRRLAVLPRPARRRQALEQVLQPRLLPQPELLREPVDGRPADLPRLAVRNGLCGQCARTETSCGGVASEPPATRRRRSPPAACSSAGSTARCAPTARQTARSCGGATSTGGSSERPSSSAISSSSRRSRRTRTPRASRTGRSSGGSAWGSTRRASPPPAITTSP